MIDPANGTVTRTIDSGSVGEQAQVSPDGRFIVGVNLLEATVDMRDLDDGRVTASVPNDDALLDIALTPALPKLSSSSNILEQLETGGRASRRRRPAGPAGQTARGSVIPAASRAGTARSSRLCTALR